MIMDGRGGGTGMGGSSDKGKNTGRVSENEELFEGL